MKPFLSVIIPTYNEAKRLPLTLIDVDKHLSAVGYDYEIIVVDDGSKDATIDIAKRLSHLIKNLRIIENEKNHGKGWVVRQGMLEAKGQWRLFMDADNATSADQFQKMMPYLADYQIIIGSRDVKGAKLVPPQPFYKRFLGNAGNIIIQILLLPGLWDTQCGFKCFSEEAAEKIFRLMKTNRWAFDVEALVLGKKFGYKIKEIPVVWVNDIHSKVKFSSYFQFLWEILKIRLRL
ncbi:hypothetical protein A3G50_01385 [Candidatus Jorgensenbacteria bacterium RIFCSPLOWO2_12_FULL_42_11]|uniref:dolichyl-phosphate beta-glucosyltransferase n=1 Tax=Candidatus Jorgensenbacteria bacterium RIFCSPLOWO2_12_FULL_42_11 TaxID=1798473 RepID=A0A1F6C185_9BACT|nr:MAG: hypothetical protein A3G50_01385 [Candidatus Jorgensenbacteria bacterium RIFCSPLOWO2_12_FULL_42_11]